MSSKEADIFRGKWAIVTLHPSLPSRTEQIARARAWGVNESQVGRIDTSALVIEDVRKESRTTNWVSKLPLRAQFAADMRRLGFKGDTVFFATPMCVGFGPGHAAHTLAELWGAGLQVYVHSVGAIYRAGDDMTEFFADLEREASAAYVRAHRKRKSS